MGIWRQISEYLYIRKRETDEPRDTSIRFMHGVNRISIFMFLTAIIILIVRALFFRRH